VIVTLYFRRFKIRNPFKASHPGWHQAVLANEKAEKIALEKAAKDAEKTFVRTLPVTDGPSRAEIAHHEGRESFWRRRILWIRSFGHETTNEAENERMKMDEPGEWEGDWTRVLDDEN
jgi:hypothetical protein